MSSSTRASKNDEEIQLIIVGGDDGVSILKENVGEMLAGMRAIASSLAGRAKLYLSFSRVQEFNAQAMPFL